MSDLQKIIKSLVQQCNIESISTKDLTAELSQLYQSVEKLENRIVSLEGQYDQQYNRANKADAELQSFKATYVLPVDKINTDRKALEDARFKFDIEKEYAKREVMIYRELLASMTAVVSKTVSRYDSNGSSYSENVFTDKPGLPQAPFQK